MAQETDDSEGQQEFLWLHKAAARRETREDAPHLLHSVSMRDPAYQEKTSARASSAAGPSQVSYITSTNAAQTKLWKLLMTDLAKRDH